MDSPTRVNLRDLERLQQKLSLIKQNCGLLTSETIWLGQRPQNSRKTEKRNEDIISILNEIKTSRDVLKIILQSAEEAIASFQPQCNDLALTTGIHALQDDTLKLVFELGAEVDPSHHKQLSCGRDFSVDISHVCRRFRCVALDAPHIWSYLHSGQSLPKLHNFIKRSKAVDLKMHVYVDELCFEACVAFWETVIMYSKRCSGLKIDSHYESYKSQSFVEKISSMSPNLQLPRLSTLIYRNHTGVSELPNELALPRYDTWLLPNVQHFHAYNSIPRQPLGTSSLVSLNLKLDSDFYIVWEKYHLTSLFAVLDHAPNLRLLSISLRNAIHNKRHPIIPNSILKVVLPNLESLSVRISGETTLALVQLLFGTLHMPAITAMSVALDLYEAEMADFGHDVDVYKATEFLKAIFPETRAYPLLKQLKLDVKCDLRADCIMPGYLLQFPSLQHLSIFGPHLNPVFSYKPTTLRTLCLKQCDQVIEHEIRRLINSLDGATFEKIRLIDCRRLSDAFLQSLKDELKGKLEFTL